MKISYSIAIVLSCTLAQIVTAISPNAIHEDYKSFKPGPFTHELVTKRNVNNNNNNNRYIATALRRRQANVFAQEPASTTTVAPTTAAANPQTQVKPILNNIRDAIKQALASDDDSGENGEEQEHEHGNEKDQEKKLRKELIKLTEKLIKALNEFLKAAGLDDSLEMDGVLKAAEDGHLAPPADNTSGQLEARSLTSLLTSSTNLDRSLFAPASPATPATPAAPAAPAAPEAPPADPENDGGDDGSTEGDDQHKERHETKPSTPGAPKVKNSDGGTEGDEEHKKQHPHPAKKRSKDDEEMDHKKISEAANKVDDALEELSGVGQSSEDAGAGIGQLVASVQKLLALFN